MVHQDLLELFCIENDSKSYLLMDRNICIQVLKTAQLGMPRENSEILYFNTNVHSKVNRCIIKSDYFGHFQREEMLKESLRVTKDELAKYQLKFAKESMALEEVLKHTREEMYKTVMVRIILFQLLKYHFHGIKMVITHKHRL